MHFEKFKIHISKDLLFNILSIFLIFPHIYRETPKMHLKNLALHHFENLPNFFPRISKYVSHFLLLSILITFPIFFMHLREVQNINSKLLILNHLIIFPIFSSNIREAQSGHLKIFALRHFDILSNFLHATREAENIYLKIFALH